jgi:AcrR family transcriptional regulator
MFSKFLNLDIEKQEKILEVAIREFADNGFEKASTNEIVKQAEISKGILFHYFQNKKKLFLFVYDYSLDILGGEILNKIDVDEGDIFIQLRKIAYIKMELAHKYPKIFKFIGVATVEECNEVKSEIKARQKKISESSYSKVFNNIDKSKFRDGVDVSRAINIIMWTFEGLSTSELQKAKTSESKAIDFEKIISEVNIYIDIFKNSFYKLP